mmetsp:Transcript_21946/g.54693  ORF Transcript_21946/g.54693 Transcript_21946/m.54693 type:complete len:159 (-) Transcript_21946:335-811(-)|eukprot:CAMPEP_0182831648 /NCGR_PEP_ID=MMETSP0006_2-20121128/19256_1 /TAXON_ID=97485 /ORGANISM="Prymnesium parvum, Strain Texoma1" /LENGTH=158 /DNA_ID=CAMNT_0024959367 /DNA_START=17 /DNA_END=493 /DNA_ORIENTATION=+
MAFAVSVIATAGLLLSSHVEVRVDQAVPVGNTRPAVRAPAFPSTSLASSLLDDFAETQKREEEILNAKRAALKKAREEQEARAAAEEAAKLKAEEAKRAKAEAILAKKKALAEAKEAQLNEAAAANNDAAAVKKVNARAERIAARKAAGEEPPKLFGL